MSSFKNYDDQKKSFDNSINNKLNKLFLLDICVTITSYKLIVPVKAVIIDYSDNILSLRFRESNLISNFNSGDPIVIHLSSNGTIYNATASVLTKYDLSMDVIVEKVLSKNDLRKENRFLVSFSGKMKFQDKDSFIVIKNISKQGLVFLSTVDLQLSSKVKITFETYNFTKISYVVSIVHKNTLIDRYSYGAFIINIDANNLKKLNYCLQNLQ